MGKSPRKSQSGQLTIVPLNAGIPKLRVAARDCKNCDLYKNATQMVFGEGHAAAKVVLIGEQPGDREDKEGHPFVGPAGKLLDECLIEAGIDRNTTYVTNVVKHFKFEPRGKRRIHEKPNAKEIAACRPWLEAEIAALQPNVIVCLGATAAQALMGRAFRVTQHRGEILETPLAPRLMATVHPSSILRAPDDESRHKEKERFVEDLRKILPLL